MTQRLTDLQRRVAYQLFMQGTSVELIAVEFGVDVSEIEGAIRSRNKGGEKQ